LTMQVPVFRLDHGLSQVIILGDNPGVK